MIGPSLPSHYVLFFAQLGDNITLTCTSSTRPSAKHSYTSRPHRTLAAAAECSACRCILATSHSSTAAPGCAKREDCPAAWAWNEGRRVKLTMWLSGGDDPSLLSTAIPGCAKREQSVCGEVEPKLIGWVIIAETQTTPCARTSD